jgi:hypothetical protein
VHPKETSHDDYHDDDADDIEYTHGIPFPRLDLHPTTGADIHSNRRRQISIEQQQRLRE